MIVIDQARHFQNDDAGKPCHICFKVSIHYFTGRLHGILKTGVRCESGLTAAGKDLVFE